MHSWDITSLSHIGGYLRSTEMAQESSLGKVSAIFLGVDINCIIATHFILYVVYAFIYVYIYTYSIYSYIV